LNLPVTKKRMVGVIPKSPATCLLWQKTTVTVAAGRREDRAFAVKKRHC
jgi:hypothetical protein